MKKIKSYKRARNLPQKVVIRVPNLREYPRIPVSQPTVNAEEGFTDIFDEKVQENRRDKAHGRKNHHKKRIAASRAKRSSD